MEMSCDLARDGGHAQDAWYGRRETLIAESRDDGEGRIEGVPRPRARSKAVWRRRLWKRRAGPDSKSSYCDRTFLDVL
jgi:hypothetical protein